MNPAPNALKIDDKGRIWLDARVYRRTGLVIVYAKERGFGGGTWVMARSYIVDFSQFKNQKELRRALVGYAEITALGLGYPCRLRGKK